MRRALVDGFVDALLTTAQTTLPGQNKKARVYHAGDESIPSGSSEL
jgi:hypothetical protein